MWRIPLRGASLGKPTRMLAGRYGRIRTVAAAPDGTLWVATSNRDGRGSPRVGRRPDHRGARLAHTDWRPS